MEISAVATVLFVVLFEVGKCAPSANSAMLYLQQYGYLGATRMNSSSLVDGRVFNSAIKEFQSFAGLPATGELDDETVKTMSLPRCGVKDKVGSGSDSRSKRYALQGSRWKVKNLSYRISKYPNNLKQKDVDKEIQKAFQVWSGYTDLNFKQQSSGAVHIEIRFEKGEHGDGDPFDGPGGTLAHAYFPVFGGDAHFDAAEQWTIDSYRGTNLFQVAAHEFGHSLGLSHSDVRSALMAPFYRGYEPVFNLDEDDIQGIQALYGKKSSSSGNRNSFDTEESKGGKKTTASPPYKGTSGDNAAICKDPKFDTIFNSADGDTYIFKGNNYFKLTDDSVETGYPKPISEGWKGLPGNIDAAFTYKNGKTYFFKGKQYWRYNGRKMDGQYPRDISEGFTGVPDDIDAAMVWSGNGKIYFFKGTKFWRFDPTQRPPVKNTYPKPLANWEGIPNSIDAAFQAPNGYTYFYKEGAYYRFNDRLFAVDPVDPAFPRSTANWWFGCKSAPRGTIGTAYSRAGLKYGEESDSTRNKGDGYDVFDSGVHHANEDSNRSSPPPQNEGDKSASSHPTASAVLSLAVALAAKYLTS